jgi:hypothetical protein
MFRRISVFEHLFSCAGRSLAFASSRLDENVWIFCQIPPKRQARSSCATVHGLGVYHLPGSKPEVIASTAPATECLHACKARMRLLYESHPRTPIAEEINDDTGRSCVQGTRQRRQSQATLRCLPCLPRRRANHRALESNAWPSELISSIS